MPKVSKETAEVEHHGPVTDRHAELEGYTVNILSFDQDIDTTPLLKGLPGNACSCPHWGYVLRGRLVFTYAEHEGEEVFEAGDAFYLAPGHIQRVEAGTEYVQFSPTEALHPVTETMTRNMRAMQNA
jgi:hypothetical protein